MLEPNTGSDRSIAVLRRLFGLVILVRTLLEISIHPGRVSFSYAIAHQSRITSPLGIAALSSTTLLVLLLILVSGLKVHEFFFSFNSFVFHR